MVFCAVFTVDLKNDANEARFWPMCSAFQHYCARCEPGTLTYEFHQAVDEAGAPVPHKYMLVERYSSKASFDVHATSAYMQEVFAFLDTLDGIDKTLQLFEGEHVAERLRSELDALTAKQKDSHSSGDDNKGSHTTDAEATSSSVSGAAALSRVDSRGPLYGKGVLVFAGARHGSDAAYTHEARQLGQYLAQHTRRPLVYGGGTVGVMGEVATATRAHGGHVVAVIPRALCPREASGEVIGDRRFFTDTMSERKSIMFAAADTVVALPGGIGTFDELLEVLTLFQLNAYRPKIGIVNVHGFFDPFFALLRHLVAQGLLEAATLDSFVVRDSAVAVMQALETFVPPPSAAASLVWHSRP